jgi:hypothetical protein
MSNMLEQAIADAAALREQAIKNAEQSVIEKYSKQIKEAVDQMLEKEDPMAKVDEVINEAEEELNEEAEGPIAGMGIEPQGSQIEAPPGWDSRYDDMMTNFSALVDNLPADENGMIDLDLGDFEMSAEEEDALGQEDTEDMPVEEPEEDVGDLGGEEEGEDTTAGGGGLDDLLSEPLQEEIDLDEVAEAVGDLLEEMEIDFDPIKNEMGHHMTNRSRKEFNQDMAEIVYEDEEEPEEKVDEEKEELMGKVNELHETVKNLTSQNNQLVDVLTKLETHLEESLLSNAKLLYQNRTLSDASLNERQKSKIVEAISNAESPKEAKRLHETLRATVGSTPSQKKGPQSLSESVNRRSNLSSMLNSRQNIKESKSADPFLEKMQKLAGIKK